MQLENQALRLNLRMMSLLKESLLLLLLILKWVKTKLCMVPVFIRLKHEILRRRLQSKCLNVWISSVKHVREQISFKDMNVHLVFQDILKMLMVHVRNVEMGPRQGMRNAMMETQMILMYAKTLVKFKSAGITS